MLGSAIIVFREALEAALIIGIIAAATRGLPTRNLWLIVGIAAGAVGSVIVASDGCYHAVLAGLSDAVSQGRWDVRLVDIVETDAVVASLSGADLLWLESPTNPLLDVADLPALIDAARAVGAIVAVDNTFATPLRQRPLDLGADIVVHSATKFIGGHSDLLCGVAVARRSEHVGWLRRRREIGGSTPGALEVFLALRGLRTMALRLNQAESNAAELALMMTAALLGLPLPLLPLHLLWINLATDGLPALALVMDPADPDALRRPPRRPDESLLGRAEWITIAWTGALQTAVVLAVYIWALDARGLDEARNLAFTVLVFGELFRAFAARHPTRLFWEVGALTNIRLLVVVAVSAALQIAIHHIPAARALFHISTLSMADCIMSVLLGLIPVTMLELVKLGRRIAGARPAMT